MRTINFVPAELIGQGLAYTVMGICIVFLILIIIMFVIKAMALFSAPEKKEEAVPAPIVEAAAEPEEDSLELIAVITAAVAAAMGTSTASIQVRSYKKLDGGAWNKAGRREVLENRF